MYLMLLNDFYIMYFYNKLINSDLNSSGKLKYIIYRVEYKRYYRAWLRD